MITKKLILIISFFVSSWVAYGQQEWTIMHPDKPDKTNSLQLSLYAEAGLGMSFYHSTDENFAPDFSPVAGVVIGGGLILNKTLLNDDKLSGKIGVLYTRFGFTSESEKVRGNYLCVPISIQYYPISNLYAELVMQPCLNIGLSPTVAYIEGLSINLEGHRANDFKVGFGVGYLFKAIPIGISARYLIGTSDFAENLPWRGNLFQISVFYCFGI